MNIDQRIEDKAKKENEGIVFAHIWVSTFSNTLFVHRDYYIVKNGVVCAIEDGKFNPSGDSVFDTQAQCIKVGKYNSKNKYKKSFKEMTYKEIKEALNL